MKKTIKINGMMCGHCEARVKKALEELPQVVSAAPDHNKNCAEVVLNGEIDDETLKAAVEKEGYEVTGIE